MLFACRISTAFFYYKEAEQATDPSLKTDLLFQSYEVIYLASTARSLIVKQLRNFVSCVCIIIIIEIVHREQHKKDKKDTHIGKMMHTLVK